MGDYVYLLVKGKSKELLVHPELGKLYLEIN